MEAYLLGSSVPPANAGTTMSLGKKPQQLDDDLNLRFSPISESTASLELPTARNKSVLAVWSKVDL